MLYRVVCHVQPPRKNLTGRGSLEAKIAHNYRIVCPPNADPKRSHFNRILIGTADGMADVLNVIRKHNPARKDSPLYFEMILSAKGEFFSKKAIELGDKFPEFLNEWVRKNVKWLKQYFDGRGNGIVVNATLHLDEGSPHIHVIIVPVAEIENRGKKSWRICHTKVLGAERGTSIYDNPKMIELQDSYAEAMAEFGLLRGERGSRAIHQEPADYRKRLTKADKEDYEAAIDALGLKPGLLSSFTDDLVTGLAGLGLDPGQVALQGAWWWQGDAPAPEPETRPRDHQVPQTHSTPMPTVRPRLSIPPLPTPNIYDKEKIRGFNYANNQADQFFTWGRLGIGTPLNVALKNRELKKDAYDSNGIFIKIADIDTPVIQIKFINTVEMNRSIEILQQFLDNILMDYDEYLEKRRQQRGGRWKRNK